MILGVYSRYSLVLLKYINFCSHQRFRRGSTDTLRLDDALLYCFVFKIIIFTGYKRLRISYN